MVISAVMTANLFNGLNTSVWTAWVFFAVFLGIVLVWLYTVSPIYHQMELCADFLLGNLLAYLPRMDRYEYIWQRLLPISLGVVLVLVTHHHLYFSSAQVSRQSLEVRLYAG